MGHLTYSILQDVIGKLKDDPLRWQPTLTTGNSHNESATQAAPPALLFICGYVVLHDANIFSSGWCRTVRQPETQSCPWKQTMSELLCFSVRYVRKHHQFSPPSFFPPREQHMNALHMDYSECTLLIYMGGQTFTTASNQRICLSAPIKKLCLSGSPIYPQAGTTEWVINRWDETKNGCWPHFLRWMSLQTHRTWKIHCHDHVNAR